MRRSTRAIVAAALALGIGVLSFPSARAASRSECAWPMYGRDLGHSFASAPGCTTLSPTTAPSIVPRWGYLTPDSVTAAPTVVDGVAYVGDWSGRFYAIPVDQGGVAAEPRWTFQVDDPSRVAFG